MVGRAVTDGWAVVALPPFVSGSGSCLRRPRGLRRGLTVIGTAVLLDLLAGARSFPLTAVMLGPLISSAVARPLGVGLLGVLSTSAGAFLAVTERISGPEAWTRVALVAVAGFAS